MNWGLLANINQKNRPNVAVKLIRDKVFVQRMFVKSNEVWMGSGSLKEAAGLS